MEQPEDKKATWALVLGIIGLVCCAPCGIAAIVLAKQAQNAGNTSGKAKAGFILGIIAVILWAVGFIISLATGAFSAIGAASSGNYYMITNTLGLF